jgi:hypothetical protein
MQHLAYPSPLHVTDTNKLFALPAQSGNQQLQLLAALSGQGGGVHMLRQNPITTQSMSMPQIINRQGHMPVMFMPGIGQVTSGSESTDRLLNLTNNVQMMSSTPSTLASVYSMLQNLPQTQMQTLHNVQQSAYPAMTAAQMYTAALESQQIEDLNKVLKASQQQQQQMAHAHKDDILRLLAQTGQNMQSTYDYGADAATKQGAASQSQILVQLPYPNGGGQTLPMQRR